MRVRYPNTDRPNAEIRLMLYEKGIMQKELAEAMGVTAAYLSNLLSHELEPRNKKRIFAVIENMK